MSSRPRSQSSGSLKTISQFNTKKKKPTSLKKRKQPKYVLKLEGAGAARASTISPYLSNRSPLDTANIFEKVQNRDNK